MQPDKNERCVVIHTAGSMAEAMVIRSLLQSAGIRSPGSVSTDPFPLRESPEGTHGEEIVVLESDAETAKDVIATYLRAGSSGSASDDTAK
ncbi:MAG: hypothetical protein WA766_14495 [Candidatus Acidiferrales bacterium]|jgi:hypothetical protein